MVILCDPSQKTPHPSTLRIAHDSRSQGRRSLPLFFFSFFPRARESPFHIFSHRDTPKWKSSGPRIFAFLRFKNTSIDSKCLALKLIHLFKLYSIIFVVDGKLLIPLASSFFFIYSSLSERHSLFSYTLRPISL